MMVFTFEAADDKGFLPLVQCLVFVAGARYSLHSQVEEHERHPARAGQRARGGIGVLDRRRSE
jgi:hypothetical protein